MGLPHRGGFVFAFDRVKSSDVTSRSFFYSATFAGTAWGILSAVTYAITNILLRRLAIDSDPIWITCIKALPTFVLACLLLGYQGWQQSVTLPSCKAVAAIVAAAVFVQIGGNLFLQWSLGVIGLALTVPISFGTLISGSAILGRLWLGEPITPRALLAMSLLMASVVILTLGAEENRTFLPQESSLASGSALVVLGIAAACVSGVAYALVAVVIRTATRQLSVAMTLFLISATGLVTLGGASLARLGVDGLLATPSRSFAYMVLAGTFNAIGFFALGKSLRLISVVHANVLNASQAAIAVVAGILLFDEPSSWSLALGVALTLAGLVVVRNESEA